MVYTFFNSDYLRSLVGDDEIIIRELIALALKKIPEQIIEITDLIEQEEFEKGAKICHNLKSNLRSVGLLSLGDLAEELEEELKVNPTLKKRPIYESLISNIDRGITIATREIEFWLLEL